MFATFSLFNYVKKVSFENAKVSGTEFSRIYKHVTFLFVVLAGKMLNEC